MDVFVARQPILDRTQTVVAYELLYRSGNANSFTQGVDGDAATSSVITNGLMLIGLDSLACGKKAFVNFTENLLKSKVALMFPKESLVVEILEDIEPTEEIIEACRELKRNGYIIALDDFVFHPKYKPLIDLADIIKVDFILTQGEERRDIVRNISNRRIKFLAEKVETQEEFQQAIRWGYTYFQGYFFSKPIIVAGKDIPASQINMLMLFDRINQKEPDFDELAAIIERDLSLTFKLLKYINQAGQYMVTHIASMKHAIMVVGLKELRKWLSVVMVRGLGEKKPDIISRMCMIRARFAEKIGLKIKMKENAPELFMMGMFSMIDVLMEKSMTDVLNELPIAESVKSALRGEEGIYSNVYQLVLAYERGDWGLIGEIAALLKINERILPDLYIEAVNWTDQVYDMKDI